MSRLSKRSKLSALLRFDAEMAQLLPASHRLVGLDEVGRGSLIASVVGGAVCLPARLTRTQRQTLKWLDDSKKLSPTLRTELAEAIQDCCITGIGAAEKEEVDEMNVHYASLLAVYRALRQVAQKLGYDSPEKAETLFLLMDGKAVIPDLPKERQRAVVKGDGCSAAIAAASVIAKCYRDDLVSRLAVQYPGYGWEKNMGYPAPRHLQGIRELGVTPLHRKNFKKVHQQLTLTLR